MVQQRIKLVSQSTHHNESLYSILLWADSDYFGEGKIKCAISKADAERQVAWLEECFKQMLLCSHVYWHLSPKVKD